MMKLSDYTTARVGLGISGESLPTAALLDFRWAHARARDAVHFPLDVTSLSDELRQLDLLPCTLHSATASREEYLRRPDLGRRLNADSEEVVQQTQLAVAFVIADGLSALAVHRHAVPLIKEIAPDKTTPIWIVQQGRVAIGDHIGDLLKAELSIVIIGERPGLSTPDSLGIYLTWVPRVGRTDAERNCISNIHSQGLSYREAAHKLAFLTTEARKRKLTGIALKENAERLLS
jgi:ethanolamine ammonia-lyase small subunit